MRRKKLDMNRVAQIRYRLVVAGLVGECLAIRELVMYGVVTGKLQ